MTGKQQQPDAFEKAARRTNSTDYALIIARVLRAHHEKVVRMVRRELQESRDAFWASGIRKDGYIQGLEIILAKLKEMEGTK